MAHDVVGAVGAAWPQEEVPDDAQLYLRAHRMFFYDEELAPGVFRDHGSAMSTEWDRYSTPDEALQRAKAPNDNGIVALRAGDVRQILGADSVRHTPQADCRAHVDVVGEKTTEVRAKLLRCCQVLRLPTSLVK